MSTPRLHIDTDCGVDDALALVLLVRAKAEIVSVSAVFGNTYVDQAAANARGILRLSGCPAEIYIGAGHGIARRRAERMRPAHGVDGLNGAGFTQRWKLPLMDRGHGADLLAYVARHGGQGLFLGPLTNLANALIGDPVAFRDWRPMVMAGAFGLGGLGPGGADFNSWSDPEALQRVLDAGVRPRLAPLDITTRITLSPEVLQAGCAAMATPLYQRLARATPAYMAFHGTHWHIAGCHPHDAVTAAALLWPDLFTFEPACLRVIGGDRAGQGRIERIDGPANAEVCVGIDAAQVQRRMMQVLFEPARQVQDANA
jgi:inosine-uridine nucleoside N-ribohydrolase